MAEYLSPGVYVEELESGMRAMEGVGTSTAGFVGMAERGPVSGTPEYVTSFADYRRKFGGYLSETAFGPNRFLPYAVEQFFQNGGTRCFIMRVAPADAKAAGATRVSVSFTAKNPGKWGNEIRVTASVSNRQRTQVLSMEEDASNAVKSFTLRNASFLSAGDVVALLQDGAVVCHNRVVQVQDGVVRFEKEFEQEVVDASLVPHRTLALCDIDLEIACGDEVETYEGVTFNPAAAVYIDNRLGQSRLVTVKTTPVDDICPPMLSIAGDVGAARVVFTLSGGSDGSCRAADDAVYIGGGAAPGTRTGLAAFEEIENVSVMAVPGITSAAVQLALVAHCERLQSRFCVLDMPLEATKPLDLLAHREAVDSSYAAMYAPWVQMYDNGARKPGYFPPSGAVLGIYARSDGERGVHKAPANEVVTGCMGLSCLYNKGEQDLLNPAGINLIRVLPGQGIRVWGGRTCSSNSLWKYVNVRRLFIFLEESIKAETNWAVFEPNDEMLWLRVRRTITMFLRDLYRAGALVGATEDEAFFVNIGRDTMTQSDILNGRLICEIGVAPSRPAEFVIFRITQNMQEQ